MRLVDDARAGSCLAAVNKAAANGAFKEARTAVASENAVVLAATKHALFDLAPVSPTF